MGFVHFDRFHSSIHPLSEISKGSFSSNGNLGSTLVHSLKYV